MPPEPKELTEARELLGKFELQISRPEGLIYLSEALSLLADVRATAESEKIAQVAVNIALAYANTIRAKVEPQLAQVPPPHWEIVDHWRKVFIEFERSGFTLPADVGAVRSRLLINKLKWDLSPAERQELLEYLQATDSK